MRDSEFWQLTYLLAIFNGDHSAEAKRKADQAVRDYSIAEQQAFCREHFPE